MKEKGKRRPVSESGTEGERGGRKGKRESEGIICLYCVSAQPLKRNGLHR